MIANDKPSLEELAHHGVKGMKWGTRRGNLNERAKAVLKETTDKKIATYTRVIANKPKNTQERNMRKIANRSKRAEASLHTGLTQLTNQRARIEAGKLKVEDYLQFIGDAPISGLLFKKVR